MNTPSYRTDAGGLTGIILETEAERQQRFLARLSIILAIAYSFCSCLVLTISILTGLVVAWILLAIVLAGLLLVILSHWLSKRLQTVQLGSWLSVISTQVIVLAACFMFGSDLPIPGYFLIPLTISMFLLRWKITLSFALLSVAGVCGLYYCEINGYQAPLQLDQPLNGYMSMGTWLIIILTPIGLSSFMVSQNSRAYKISVEQTNHLNQALNEIEHKRQFSQTVGEQVNSVIVELNATATQQASGSQQQAVAITQSITSLEELNQTASEIALKSNNIDNLAGQILALTQGVKDTSLQVVQAGEQGRVAVDRTINSNQQVSVLYQRLVERLGALLERSDKIKGITELIRIISNETHLLSLNATIEAAGAGVYGERFGVVAGEVKNLANRSVVASREINQVLTEVEEGISQAVEVVKAGQVETEQAVSLAEESGRVIQELAVVVSSNAEAVEKVTEKTRLMGELTQEINYATNQQSSASKQAVEILRQVGTVAQQGAASSRQLTVTAGNLEDLSRGLKEALN